MKCDVCKWDYPFEYLAPLISSGVNKSNCCGICALELSNQQLGIKRTRFTGTIAEEMRQKAIKWRDTHTKE